MTTSSMADEPAATESVSSEGLHSSEQGSDDAIRVCVRFRPLTPNEVAKHESEVWGKVDDVTVGVVGRFGVTAKYAFDKVYGPDSMNGEIYQNMVADLVDSVPDGICNTVFAYGVTSSGKTHTMHGTDAQPGMVTRALRQLFECAYGDTTRDYMLRISYVEIYNEVINDLLDPARTNLRVVEDPVKGQVVEGARECPILTAEEALELVAQGEENRRVSATAANEGSSRSHTIVKVSVESTSTATATSGPTRRLSALNLIDLAGSEAAKVQQSKEQSREGSYINRSLLALGTVIAKLGDRNASHIPFRDSKLTRLLASSLSGRGARVCIVCTATPTAAQAEETHNTLKFAMRAKAVRVSATRNERSNTYELLMRYQQEVADLRQQLWHMQKGHGGHAQPSPFTGVGFGGQQHPSAPQPGPVATAAGGSDGGRDLASLQEVLALREQLEEERAVRVMYEREREELKNRVVRLTRLAMSSEHHVPPPEHLSQEAQLASEAAQEDRGNEDVEVEVWRAEQSLGLTQNGVTLDSDVGASQYLHNTENTVDMSDYHNVIMGMREQMLTLQDELTERDRQISELRTQGESILANASMIRIEAERDLDASDAELSEPQVSAFVGESEGTETWQDQQVLTLQDEYKALEQQLQAAKEENEKLRRARAHDTETLRRLQSMEGQVQVVVQELNAKERQLQAERKTLLQFQDLEKQVEMQLNETSQENSKLRLELQRLETNNNRLQGYQLDSMSGTELSHLVRSLTQAVERVRVTVQMRRLATPSPPDGSPRAPGAAQEPQLPSGGRSPEAGRRGAAHRQPPPPPLILTGGNATESSQPSAASPLSFEQRDAPRNFGSQQLSDLHRAMPSLRQPKPYNFSRTPEGGTPRTPNTTSSSGPSSSRSGNFLL